MRSRFAAALFVAASSAALAQQPTEHSWMKNYPVTGKPSLFFETGDAGVEMRSCGECREVRIAVEVEGKKMSDYHLEESQAGDQIHFRLREREHVSIYIAPHRSHMQVTVETPTHLTLQAKTADGNVTLTGLEGELAITSGDGSVTLDHLSGDLRLKASDGRVRITDASGALEARTSDASLTVDGVFHALALRTSDGALDVHIKPGSKLTSAASMEASDGPITVRLPKDFSADIDVHTSDGHIDCALPLTMDVYQSKGGDGHQLHGRLNGGGTPLSIHTSDGNVTIGES